MGKNNVLVLDAGGTWGYKDDGRGIYSPSSDSYLHMVDGLDDIADITYISLGAVDSENVVNYDWSTFVDCNSEIDHDSDPFEIIGRERMARVIYDSFVKVDCDYAPQFQLGQLRDQSIENINHHKNAYDGIVALQGTDTAVGTGAAFSYMLRNFGIPIVVAGTQDSVWKRGSPAKRIFRSAIRLATLDVGETILTDGSYVTRANRAIKINSGGRRGKKAYPIFASLTYPSIGRIDSQTEEIELYGNHIRRDNSKLPKIYATYEIDFGTHRLFSGSDNSSTLDEMLEDEYLPGILLEAWGLGTFGPAVKENKVLKNLENPNTKPIAVVTECLTGGLDLQEYSQGWDPDAVGLIDCADLTWHAAGQKFAQALSMAEDTGLKINTRRHFEYVRDFMRIPINGDMTLNRDDRYVPDLTSLFIP